MTLYRLRKDNLFHNDIGSYISYGIDIFDGSADKPIRSIPDISCKREPLEALIFLCNNLQLDVIHIDDVIEDFFI